LAAQQEVDALQQERTQHRQRMEWIELRLQHLAAHLKTIQPLIEQAPGQSLVHLGLTPICRDLLAQVDKWVTAPEVRDLLAQKGVDHSGYSNPMAVLHSVLKRVGQTCKAKDHTCYGRKGLPRMAPLPNVDIEQAAAAGAEDDRAGVAGPDLSVPDRPPGDGDPAPPALPEAPAIVRGGERAPGGAIPRRKSDWED